LPITLSLVEDWGRHLETHVGRWRAESVKHIAPALYREVIFGGVFRPLEFIFELVEPDLHAVLVQVIRMQRDCVAIDCYLR
jgi:hypothetical protein